MELLQQTSKASQIARFLRFNSDISSPLNRWKAAESLAFTSGQYGCITMSFHAGSILCDDRYENAEKH
jgi:hypothetical protein